MDPKGHWLVGLDGSVEGQRFALGPDPVNIGRGADCQVRLVDPRVSKNHARITWSDGSCSLEDLNSSNGTSVNGLVIRKVVLQSGDHLQLGDTILEYQAPGVEAKGETRAIQTCVFCGRELAASDSICPGCGAPRRAMS